MGMRSPLKGKRRKREKGKEMNGRCEYGRLSNKQEVVKGYKRESRRLSSDSVKCGYTDTHKKRKRKQTNKCEY